MVISKEVRKMKEQKSLFGTAKHYKVKVKKAKENPIKYILSVL